MRIKVLVIQMGARRSYELAQMLEAKGALAALQTGAAWHERRPPPNLLMRLYSRKLSAFTRRTIRNVPLEKARTTLLPELAVALLKMVGAPSDVRYGVGSWLLGQAARRGGIREADIVLSPGGDGGLAFLKWARRQGLLVAVDVCLHPRSDRIIANAGSPLEGRALWNSDALIRRREARWIELFSNSDLLLCPSKFVADGVRELCPEAADKIRLVPYSLGGSALIPSPPIPRTVLFAGSNAERKGLRFLAEAMQPLYSKGYSLRVAGTVPDAIKAHTAFQGATFLGHLGPREMKAEYQKADMFCLPSLAEGLARVTLEALACGVPCIVTPGAGAPVQNGVEGLVVREMDSSAIARAIEAIGEDRELRQRMSEAAFATAMKHRPEVVSEVLYATLADAAPRR